MGRSYSPLFVSMTSKANAWILTEGRPSSTLPRYGWSHLSGICQRISLMQQWQKSGNGKNGEKRWDWRTRDQSSYHYV